MTGCTTAHAPCIEAEIDKRELLYSVLEYLLFCLPSAGVIKSRVTKWPVCFIKSSVK